MRILLFSERLRAPYDEGIKGVALHLSGALAAEHDVMTLTSNGADDLEYDIRNMSVNRLLFSAQLGREIRHFAPQAIVYVPTACATVFSFARARMLRRYARHAPIALITLQPRHYTAVGRILIRHLVPDCVLVAQSRRTCDTLRDLGCRTALLPPAVDTRRFAPASPGEKAALRDRYGIPLAAKVVTHVGHLKGKRNLACFLSLQSVPDYHSVVVASTSTPQDENLKKTLCTAGVTVIDTYIANVEDIYRLSDAYLFVAEDDTAAIEMPLSVLEAMACNLPVICTPFGGLRDFFAAGDGLFYWDGQVALVDLVATALSKPVGTRMLIEPYTWSAAARALVRVLQDSQETQLTP